jgi:hypothetical protein
MNPIIFVLELIFTILVVDVVETLWQETHYVLDDNTRKTVCFQPDIH